MLMPNLLSDYVGYHQNLCILNLFGVYFGLRGVAWRGVASRGEAQCLRSAAVRRVAGPRAQIDPKNRAKVDPPEGSMGSKSAQNLRLMPNLLSDYVGYNLNLCILNLVGVYFGLRGVAWRGLAWPGVKQCLRSAAMRRVAGPRAKIDPKNHTKTKMKRLKPAQLPGIPRGTPQGSIPIL